MADASLGIVPNLNLAETADALGQRAQARGQQTAQALGSAVSSFMAAKEGARKLKLYRDYIQKNGLNPNDPDVMNGFANLAMSQGDSALAWKATEAATSRAKAIADAKHKYYEDLKIIESLDPKKIKYKYVNPNDPKEGIIVYEVNPKTGSEDFKGTIGKGMNIQIGKIGATTPPSRTQALDNRDYVASLPRYEGLVDQGNKATPKVQHRTNFGRDIAAFENDLYDLAKKDNIQIPQDVARALATAALDPRVVRDPDQPGIDMLHNYLEQKKWVTPRQIYDPNIPVRTASEVYNAWKGASSPAGEAGALTATQESRVKATLKASNLKDTPENRKEVIKALKEANKF